MTHAYAPGHVSGLFAVHDASTDPLQRGSRGAGWSVDKGAWATVEQAPETAVVVNGKPGGAVTEAALEVLAPGQGLQVQIRLDLPVGQGFGMSAAGTLAACLAAADVLGLEPEEALHAAHTAEVTHGTGLGDAIGSWYGGGELRIKPGCPPHGWAMRVEAPEATQFLYCVLGDPLPTENIIQKDTWRARTREHGDAAVDRILDAGRADAWSKLVTESAVFSHKLGLMPARMVSLGADFPQGVQWGQCMLGSTMWISAGTGDLDRVEAVLEGHGPCFRGRVDPHGARLVRQVPA